MSGRLWRKLKSHKALRKREQKELKARLKEAQRAVGRRTGPSGRELVVTECPSCHAATTEIWLRSAGQNGCPACVENRETVMFAVIDELWPDGARRHLV